MSRTSAPMVDPDNGGVDMFGAPIASPPTVRQLPLPLGWHQAATASVGLVIGAANREAVALVAQPALWGSPALLLVGPAGSGKSALAQQFAAAHLGDVIDPLSAIDATGLFHRWNRAHDNGHFLLVVTRSIDDVAAVTLADLQTRLSSAPVARMDSPDACLARDLVENLLVRRGLEPSSGLGNYVAARIERTYDAIHAAVAAIDAAALASGGGATIARARRALMSAGLYAAPLPNADEGND